MPYLKKCDKEKVSEKGCWELEEHFSKLPAQDFAGHINYLNYRLVNRWIEKNGKRYWICALMVGTLICCVFELYRRVIGRYEDEAIKKNGDWDA